MTSEREPKGPQLVFPLSQDAINPALNWLIDDFFSNPIVNLEIKKNELEESNRADYVNLIDMTNLRGDISAWTLPNRRAYQTGFLFGLTVIGNRYKELGKPTPNVENARTAYFKSLLVDPDRTIDSDPEYKFLAVANHHLDKSVVSPQAISLLNSMGTLPDYIIIKFQLNSERKKNELFAGEAPLSNATPLIRNKMDMIDAEFFAYGVLDAHSPFQVHETVGEAAEILKEVSL